MSIANLLERHGILNPGRVHWNRGTATLYEEAIRGHEGIVAESGPLVCVTGVHTGRSPNDKFLVREPSSQDNVWWGKVNRSIEPGQFRVVRDELLASLTGKELYVQDCVAGADPEFSLRVRVVTERAWHSLFARTMFLESPPGADPAAEEPEFTVIDIPSVEANPAIHGTNSPAFILVDFSERLVLIGGTSYAGEINEIKKSIFTVMNYLLPLRDVLPMHCSANIGAQGDVALFFGLSGTGKTTLSSDPERRLIGDDEHGWSTCGVFNFEGGCYAKMIRLSEQAEPQIYATTRRFGTVLENVVIDPDTRTMDLDDDSLTENTRGAYPISFVDNWVPSGQGGHPESVNHADGRRVRCASANFAVEPRGCDVSLPLRLHGQGCRYRKGGDRSNGHLQYLLRRSVHGLAPSGLRPAAGPTRR